MFISMLSKSGPAVVASTIALQLLTVTPAKSQSSVEAGPFGEAFPTVRMARTGHGGLNGQRAIDGLGTRIEAIAKWYGKSGRALRKELMFDRRLRVDDTGRLFVVEEIDKPLAPPGRAAAARGLLDGTLAPLTDTFKLHSKPNAPRTLHLNFQGATLQNTGWNRDSAVIRAVPFDIDGNPAAFSTAELQRIQFVWQRVAEDFAPLDINVTTERPPQDRLTRSSAQDQLYGGTVLFTNTQGVYACSCGGVAYLRGFGNDRLSTGLVFADKLGNGFERYVAEAASHEAGHLLGLMHDGSPAGAYYWGHGLNVVNSWAPIMGVGYNRPLVQWSKGEYANANNKEDDLAVMQQFAPPRPDEAGDTRQTAAALPLTVTNGQATGTAEGVIARQGDKDVYAFTAANGSFRANVTPSTRSPNADLVLTLLSDTGAVLASSNPQNALDATIVYQIFRPGTYYLQVSSTGQGNPLTDGYSDYGSLGNFRLSASFTASAGSPPVASLTVTPASGPAPLAVRMDASASRDDGQVRFIYWNFGDGTTDDSGALRVANKTYTNPGTYPVTIRVVDDMGLTSSTSQTVTVTSVSANRPGLTANVNLATLRLSQSSWAAQGTLFVTDTAGKRLENARVSYSWSGLQQGNRSITSQAQGSTILSLATTQRGCYVLTVTEVTLNGYSYNPASPVRAQACL